MALAMSARAVTTGVSSGGVVLGASVRALGVGAVAPCVCASRGRSFHCGVKTPPVFRDSCFFPRLDANSLTRHRQPVRRGGSSVAMRAAADSRLQEVRFVTSLDLRSETRAFWNLIFSVSL
jgi:hypothetical protein